MKSHDDSFRVIPSRDDGEAFRSPWPLSFIRTAFLIVFGLTILLAPQIASACPVCFGSPDSPMSKATSNGIAVLLGFVVFVQIGFAAMFWSFWRRAQALRRRKEEMRVIQGGLH